MSSAVVEMAVAEPTTRRDSIRLVALSFLMLFLELALIRWTGSNVLYLSYFSNFVLLGSFLGIGLGFLRAGAQRSSVWLAPILLGALIAYVWAFPVVVSGGSSSVIYFGITVSGLPMWVTLQAIFFSVAVTMMAVGEAVARTFIRFTPLEAYRLDIGGSLLGIIGFAALSFAGAPPLVWGTIVAVLMVVLIVVPGFQPTSRGKLILVVQIAALALVLVALGRESIQARTLWSPYYKISWFEKGKMPFGYVDVHVNGIPHQQVQSRERRAGTEPFYLEPYRQRVPTALDDVLIIGAGNGTDVAFALQQGAKRVDAVEIDPRLRELGVKLHPDRPWQDERVTAHITDGRAFMHQSSRKYDLILFALPDSLTLVSGQSSLRLESYLFTRDAMREARKHLKPGGTFTMYNYYREDWLVDRLAGTLDDIYGHPPCMVQTPGNLAVMLISEKPSDVECDKTWKREAGTPSPARDDYPFLYLRERGIPMLYLGVLAMILVGSLFAVRVASGPLRSMGRYVDLLFMGAAFLLLETKNIVQFALLFGTTWLVNALVFAAILVSVLAAIEVTRRWQPKRPELLYVALFASLAVAFMVPASALLELDYWPRFFAAGALAFTPIFIANLIFAERFRTVGASTVAFGANLLGAMLGGLLEYMALLTGYRMLLIAVAVLYGCAFLSGRSHLRPRAAAQAPEGSSAATTSETSGAAHSS